LKEPILRAHAGWSQKSQMHLRYEHWFGNEHSKALLQEYGVVSKDEFTDDLLLMKPKQCPNCNEGNKKDSRFYSACKMILSYDGYEQILEDQKQKENRLTAIETQLKSMVDALQNMDQSSKNQLAKQLVAGGLCKPTTTRTKDSRLD
jgi:hypothetical protein